MALTDKVLAFIQLANSKGTIYDPPTDTKANIHNILLHNINTTPETVELLYHDGTNEYFIYKMTLASNETVHLSFLGEGLIIDSTSGAKLTGNTTTAAKVTIKVDGTEDS